MNVSGPHRFLKTVSLSLMASVSFMGLSQSAYAKKGMSYEQAPEDAALLGDYLSGSYANLLRDAEARAENFKQAFDASPKDTRLGRRDVTAALTNGNFSEARDLSRRVYKVDKKESMAQAILAIEAFEKGRNSTVSRYLNSDSVDITMAIVMSFTEMWNHADKGDFDKAIKAAEKQDGRPYFGDLAKLQKAKIYALRGDVDKANTLYEELEETGQSSVETVLSMARFYANSDQRDKAKSVLATYIEKTGIESGPIQSYARAADAAEVYLQLALHIDPKNEKAKLWLASLLDRTERSETAMGIYKSFSDSSPYVISARLSEANIYFDRDEDDKALKVLTNLNENHQTFVTREALGRARLIREKYEEALPIYNAIVESMSEEDIQANTQPLYFRGIIFERIKQWEKAEVDFLRVLEVWVGRITNLASMKRRKSNLKKRSHCPLHLQQLSTI